MTFSTASLRSFEDFYEEWYPRAERIARKRGLQDSEAVANQIMLQFFEKDYISKYDPARDDSVSFDSWVNAMVYRRMADAWRAEKAEKDREVKYALRENDRIEDDFDSTEFKIMAKAVFTLIEERYGSGLSDVWASVVKQVIEDDLSKTNEVRAYVTGEHVGIRREVASIRLQELRWVLRKDPDLRELTGVDNWTRAAA